MKMNLNFYFVLHPLEWACAGDAEMIFYARYISHGLYSIQDSSNGHPIILEIEEVKESIKENRWIITDENGEHLTGERKI